MEAILEMEVSTASGRQYLKGTPVKVLEESKVAVSVVATNDDGTTTQFFVRPDELTYPIKEAKYIKREGWYSVAKKVENGYVIVMYIPSSEYASIHTAKEPDVDKNWNQWVEATEQEYYEMRQQAKQKLK